MSRKRLNAETRILCLLGPCFMLVLFLGGRVVVPIVQRHEVLRRFTTNPCVFHRITGIPCPFCGGTRSVVKATEGQWRDSWEWSPLGIFLVVGGTIISLWLAICAVTGYDLGLRKVGRLLNRKETIYIALGLVVLLWINQIYLWIYVWAD